MAWLNDVYVFVKDESLKHDIESTTHPVENGVNITDHIKKIAFEISLTGSIVYHDGISAADTLARLKEMQLSGTIINYAGRNIVSNLIIEQFSTSHPNTISGGADFSMVLKEIRIAQPAYNSVGLGYNADDMKDVADIAAVNNEDVYTKEEVKEIKPCSVGGDSQIEHSDQRYAYHTVESGETIYDIIEAYRDLSPCFAYNSDKAWWIIQQTPEAFENIEDEYSLIVGSRILVGWEDDSHLIYLSRRQYDLENRLGTIVRNEKSESDFGWWHVE